MPGVEEDDHDERDAAPFGGPLTESFYRGLEQALRDSLEAGMTEEELTTKVNDLEVDDMLGKVADGVFADLLDKLGDHSDYLSHGEQSLRDEMRDVWGPADDLYRASSYVAYELGAAIAESRDPSSGASVGAILGAHARALGVAGEVRLLALNGFHAGAQARWRSLHDLAVLCSVLNEAPDEISERYAAYAAIESYRDLVIYQEHAAALNREPFSDEEVEAAREEFEAVKARWGSEMAKPHGWAFPLFPGVKKLDFNDLERLAGLSHYRPFYRLGNNFVHAGPRGLVLNTQIHPETGVRQMRVGATIFEDIAETCHGAMLSLHQATSSLTSAYLAEGGDGAVDVLVSLMIQQRFVDLAGEAWGAAADEARSRGWFTHRP